MHPELGCCLHLRQVRHKAQLPYSLTLDTSSYTTLHSVLPDSAYNTIAFPDAPLIHSTFRISLEYYTYVFPAISHTYKGGPLGKNNWVSMGAKWESHRTPNHNMALIILASQ